MLVGVELQLQVAHLGAELDSAPVALVQVRFEAPDGLSCLAQSLGEQDLAGRRSGGLVRGVRVGNLEPDARLDFDVLFLLVHSRVAVPKHGLATAGVVLVPGGCRGDLALVGRLRGRPWRR